MISRFVANSEKCRKNTFLGGSAQIITILHRFFSKFITILQWGAQWAKSEGEAVLLGYSGFTKDGFHVIYQQEFIS